METGFSETKDRISDEVWGSSVIVFEGCHACAWMGVLCGICRVQADIQFSCAVFKLINEKGGDV